MSEQSVLVAIIAVLAVFLLWLFLRGRESGTGGDQHAALPVASDELSELELDRAMGRISEEDYARFRRELDATVLPAPPLATPAVEENPTAARDRAELLVRQWSAADRPECSTCGRRPEPGARFCSTCGASLAPDREA